MHMHKWFWVAATAGLLGTARAQQVPDPALHARNKAAVATADRAAAERYKNNPDVFLRPGLVADRRTRTVALRAESTGITGGTTVEFFLIAENSGHGYEAVALSFAGAGDVQAALKFIGLQPGRPVDPNAFRFWPRGERVIMHVSAAGATNWPPGAVRAERLVKSTQNDQPLPETGFVFTGSPPVTNAALAAAGVVRADEGEPQSIASNYNEPQTVLDVPRKAPQGDVYNTQVMHPDFALPFGVPLEIVLAPARPDGASCVREAVLAVSPAAAGGGTNGAALRCELTAGAPGATNRAAVAAGADTWPATLQTLRQWIEGGFDPYVTLRVDPRLRLDTLGALCRALQELEQERGIRVEPPEAGQFYFLAHVSPERFRARSERPGEAWELRLEKSGAAVRGTLTKITLNWNEATNQTVADTLDYPLAKPADLRAELTRRGPGLPVVLVFADAGVTQGELLSYLTPAVLTTHNTVHIFIGPPGK